MNAIYALLEDFWMNSHSHPELTGEYVGSLDDAIKWKKSKGHAGKGKFSYRTDRDYVRLELSGFKKE